MARPSGRVASPYRPGLFIRDYLEGYGEGSVSDMYKAYCKTLPIPPRRPSAYKLKRSPQAPSYASFARYFHFFKQLSMVELVIEPTGEPKAEPPTGVAPALWDKISWRHFYRLTDKGVIELRLWENPHLGFKVPIPYKPPPVKVIPPKLVPPVWKPLTLGKSPTKVEINKLIRHLESLRGLAHEPEVVKEMDSLAYATGDWVFALEERVKRLTGARRIEAETLLSSIDKASEAIGSYDLQSAIRNLEATI